MKRDSLKMLGILLLLTLVTLLILLSQISFVDGVKAYLHHYDLRAVSTNFGMLFVALIIEILGTGWSKSSLRKILSPQKSVQADIVYCIIYYFFGSLVFMIFSLGTTKIFPGILRNLVDIQLLHTIPSHLAQVFVALLIVDFIGYWHHWLCHRIQWLWEIHKYHHSATDFAIITGLRLHPLERVLLMYFTMIPLAVLGAPIETFVSVIIIQQLIEKLQHSMVDWNYGWWGRWVIYGPVGHRIHHSMEREHWDKNLGNIFVFWDRIFGTYYTGQRINEEVGVTDNVYNQHSLLWDTIESMKLSAGALRKSICTGKWLTSHLYEEERKF